MFVKQDRFYFEALQYNPNLNFLLNYFGLYWQAFDPNMTVNHAFGDMLHSIVNDPPQTAAPVIGNLEIFDISEKEPMLFTPLHTPP